MKNINEKNYDINNLIVDVTPTYAVNSKNEFFIKYVMVEKESFTSLQLKKIKKIIFKLLK